jgi:hypothetical protein
MFYIHQTSCISHQPTFNEVDLENLQPSADNQLHALEPKYSSIPPGQLRRMGRALRMGVGTGMRLLESNKVDGMLIATANGGIEDSITFLNQIIDYEEGRLTPTNFVQSTFNAIAGLMGMITNNKGYNATHVHRGLAFENVVLDAALLLMENPTHSYLIGGVDEISVRNYRMEAMAGWYKKEPVSNAELYNANTPGALPGEGAAMFVVSNNSKGATSRLAKLQMVHTTSVDVVKQQLQKFIENERIDFLLSGESGDSRFVEFYRGVESMLSTEIGVARFKHMTGEFQTVSALALWLACHFAETGLVAAHALKRNSVKPIQRILIYNNYHAAQHSFMLVEKV